MYAFERDGDDMWHATFVGQTFQWCILIQDLVDELVVRLGNAPYYFIY